MSEFNGLAQTDEAQFDAGYQDAWVEYEPGEKVGDPVGVDEDYRFGWWNGIGDVSAWHEGWAAYEKGLRCCPYIEGADDECFREPWLKGLRTAQRWTQRPEWPQGEKRGQAGEFVWALESLPKLLKKQRGGDVVLREAVRAHLIAQAIPATAPISSPPASLPAPPVPSVVPAGLSIPRGFDPGNLSEGQQITLEARAAVRKFVETYPGGVKAALTHLNVAHAAGMLTSHLAWAYRIKSANLITGEVGWRADPPSVAVKGVDAVMALLEQAGLDAYIRTRREIDKAAILADRSVAAVAADEFQALAAERLHTLAGIPGISIREGIEQFFVAPFEQTAD